MRDFPGGAVVKNPPTNAGDARDLGWILGSRRSLGGGKAAHCSILAWRIPWTEEPGGLSSMDLQRHDWATKHHAWHKDFPAGPVVKTLSFQCRGHGPLVRELRSCMLHSATKIIEKNYGDMASLLRMSSALYRHFPLHASFLVLNCVMCNCLC